MVSKPQKKGSKDEVIKYGKGENFYRDAKKLKRLRMYKGGKPVRDSEGNIVKQAYLQNTEKITGLVAPNQKWFGSTRVISQNALEHFKKAIGEKKKNTYQVLLKRNKLPLSLLEDKPVKDSSVLCIKETESYSSTFGPKMKRKKPRIAISNFNELITKTNNEENKFDENYKIEEKQDFDDLNELNDPVFNKGKSKRIWNELFKVIDSSDVLIHVIDARDPLGTRCSWIERYIEKEASHKHLIYLLNKCDLIPTSVTTAWIKKLSCSYPTLAFRASINNSFGKGSLIQLLRQFSSLHSNRKQISVGFVGYPNTGKSSIINTLKKKNVCSVAPLSGETKIWQYVTLMKKIFLIDCPGIVPFSKKDTNSKLLFRGAIRVENIENPESYIPYILQKCQRKHLERVYDVSGWSNIEEDPSLLDKAVYEFIDLIAKKRGRLLKNGEPDINIISKQLINDFNRGKIPWFTMVHSESTD